MNVHSAYEIFFSAQCVNSIQCYGWIRTFLIGNGNDLQMRSNLAILIHTVFVIYDTINSSHFPVFAILLLSLINWNINMKN